MFNPGFLPLTTPLRVMGKGGKGGAGGFGGGGGKGGWGGFANGAGGAGGWGAGSGNTTKGGGGMGAGGALFVFTGKVALSDVTFDGNDAIGGSGASSGSGYGGGLFVYDLSYGSAGIGGYNTAPQVTVCGLIAINNDATSAGFSPIVYGSTLNNSDDAYGKLTVASGPDADGDGYSACVDCDDTNPAVHPGVTEYCDGVDNDCDGYLDRDDSGWADLTKPTALCKTATAYILANGIATIIAADVNNSSHDDCSAASELTLTVSPSSFTVANLGANTVTLTVKDLKNNVATCTATVTVIKNDSDGDGVADSDETCPYDPLENLPRRLRLRGRGRDARLDGGWR